NRKISAIAHAPIEPAKGKKAATSVKTAELQKPGKSTSDISADPRAIPATPAPGREAVAKSAEAQFLRRLHKGACGVFGTVLGPEANEAHRDHFHFDLAHRRNSAYCQ
ncbi:MAG TPA: extensin family protein, partial [Terriglobales bacterium]|nr:extensin family protein [Terriglobales bacterium]